MLFGIDDPESVITISKENIIQDPTLAEYTFKPVILVDEAEMFQDYRRRKNILESKTRINGSDDIRINVNIDGTYKYNTTAFGSQNMAYHNRYPNNGGYIIPKLFGYFPVLDCDDLNTYNEAKFMLSVDNIPHVAYKSNPDKDSYWIFCDKQGSFDETISVIERYPCDHRYPWIAKMKNELCVRAVPRTGGCPIYMETYSSLFSALSIIT